MLLEPDNNPAGKTEMHISSFRVENMMTKLELGAENTFSTLSFKKGDYKKKKTVSSVSPQ